MSVNLPEFAQLVNDRARTRTQGSLVWLTGQTSGDVLSDKTVPRLEELGD